MDLIAARWAKSRKVDQVPFTPNLKAPARAAVL
ncbi:hypothetical protein GN278_06915 [Rhodobacteraceae bacterium Araon29]